MVALTFGGWISPLGQTPISVAKAMDSIFLAHWFSDQDRPLLPEIEEICFSLGIRLVTGRNVGGERLDEALMERIGLCDGLVALATRREETVAKSWITHPWVLWEFDHATKQNLRSVALVETGVAWGGPRAPYQWIEFDRTKQNQSLLELSKALALWKHEAGKRLKIQLLPATLNLKDDFECQYRFTDMGKESSWRKGRIVTEPGGAYLFIDGIRDDRQSIKVQVKHKGTCWESTSTPQVMPVTLLEV
jgi:hypothetical protein